MSIEVTKERLSALGLYEGKITVESDNVYDNEIVVRIPFGDGKRAKALAESAYNQLLDLQPRITGNTPVIRGGDSHK